MTQASDCMEALGIPIRLNIFKILVAAGDKGLSVGQIQERTGVPRSTVSHHIHRLIQASLIFQERAATTLICRANYEVMNSLIDFLKQDCCTEESQSSKTGKKVAAAR